jgi:hypothetical protein
MRMTVVSAIDEELAVLRADDLGDGDPSDTLTDWHLLSTHSRPGLFQLYAAGYSAGGDWVAVGPIVAVERLLRVRTLKGEVCILGQRSLIEGPGLRDRVRSAMIEVVTKRWSTSER